MTFKQKIKTHYQNLLAEKIQELRFMISDLARDAQNDAKGSAGDKHETALAMMHLEQEKLNHKLAENLNLKAVIDKIDASSKHNKIALGSLVQANEMWFYISGAMPKIQLEDKTIIRLRRNLCLKVWMSASIMGDAILVK